MQPQLKVIEDLITHDRSLLIFGEGAWHRIGTIALTKWKAFGGMQSAIIDLCQKRTTWENLKIEVQAVINAAPSVHPGDYSAQMFDPLKLLRDGSTVGDLLTRAAQGDQVAARQLPAASMKEEMIRAFGSHIVRFTSVRGEGLATGILLRLPDDTHAIITCSHVWNDHLAKVKDGRIQILRAATLGDIVPLNQSMIQIPVDRLWTLDMDDSDFKWQAGVNGRRDATIIVGDFRHLILIGATPFNLNNTWVLQPQTTEKYALVGYPLAEGGELGAQFLVHESAAKDFDVFSRDPRDQRSISLNGASGGLVVAYRNCQYRPVAMMLGQSGPVDEASTEMTGFENPSLFYALPLEYLRTMIKKVGILSFQNRKGEIRQCDFS